MLPAFSKRRNPWYGWPRRREADRSFIAMFVDHIRIHARAGDGGHGCASFRREKYVPKGGPDGGDGGDGGDVVLVVDEHTDNLRAFFYQPNHEAERGIHGKGQKRTGRSGRDRVLKVPPGTLVYRAGPPTPKGHAADDPELEFDEDADWAGEFVEDASGATVLASSEKEASSGDPENSDDESDGDSPARELLADLTEPGQRFVLCRGGEGGLGNWHFRSDTNQAPIEFTMGGKGEEGWFHLELRRIADIGLVGFPNAGKSTLLRALSNAEPRVAAYPFTTLQPMVGVVEFPGFYRATVADIPGLIEGAHANVGLGHDFLRHISRCSVFLFVVDAAAVDQRDPVSDIQILRKELRLYDEELGERHWLVVANKIDLEETELFLPALRQRFPKQEIFPISAERGDGLDDLRRRLCELTGSRPEK